MSTLTLENTLSACKRTFLPSFLVRLWGKLGVEVASVTSKNPSAHSKGGNAMRQIMTIRLLVCLLFMGCAPVQQKVASQSVVIEAITIFHDTSSSDRAIRSLLVGYLKKSGGNTAAIIEIRRLASRSEIAKMMAAFEKGSAFAFISIADVNSSELRNYGCCHQTKNEKFVLLRN